MSDEKNGRVALDEVLRQQHEDADLEDQQFSLFAAPQTEAGRARLPAGPRAPGRPLGSKNKRTEKMVSFLLSRHRDPREVLLEIAAANVHDLAALYSCSIMGAAQEKRLAAAAVLPYVASRQPLAVEITKRSIVNLMIVDGGATEPAEDNLALTMTVLDALDYQPVDPDAPAD